MRENASSRLTRPAGVEDRGGKGRAMREEASKDMPRGMHLTAVHPVLFFSYFMRPALKCNAVSDWTALPWEQKGIQTLA